jgi:hypothetical protein
MAITWRNVDAPSTAGVAQGMQSAAGSVNDAFGIFNKLLQQRESFDANEVAKGHEANKQAFLDALSQAKTPEELAQLQASGNLDVLKARLNPEGLAAVRGADEARLTSLRQQTTAANQFAEAEAARLDKPWEQEVTALMTRGKYADARTMASSMRNPGQMLNAITLAEQAAIKTGDERAKTKIEREKAAYDLEQARLTDPLRRNQMRASTAASEAAAGASVAAVEEIGRRAQLAEADRIKQEAATKAAGQISLLKDAGNIYVDGVLNPNDTQSLNEMLVKNGVLHAGKREAMIRRLQQIGGEMELPYVNGDNKLDTKKVPIPLSLVKQAILGASDQLIPDRNERDPNGLRGLVAWNEGMANSMDENLTQSMKQIVQSQLADGREYKQNKTVQDFTAYMNARLNAVENPGASAKKK